MNEIWLVYNPSAKGGDRFTITDCRESAENIIKHDYCAEIEVYVFIGGDRPAQKWMPYVKEVPIALEEVMLGDVY